MDRLESRVRIGWLILQLCGVGWLSWMLFGTVRTNYNSILAVVVVVGLLSVVGVGVYFGYKSGIKKGV